MNRHISLFSFLTLAVGAAYAGSTVDGNWSPSGCGTKPVAPTLDLRSDTAFNKSVEAVNQYRQTLKPYLDCVVKEANADIKSITQSAQAIQQAAKEDNDKITVDAKAAEAKFK